ncbi:hypothetical protein LXL04_039304 [Taraxacum kok-saghyz]
MNQTVGTELVIPIFKASQNMERLKAKSVKSCIWTIFAKFFVTMLTTGFKVARTADELNKWQDFMTKSTLGQQQMRFMVPVWSGVNLLGMDDALNSTAVMQDGHHENGTQERFAPDKEKYKVFFPVSGGILVTCGPKLLCPGCSRIRSNKFHGYGDVFLGVTVGFWKLNQNARTYIDKGQFGHSDQICNFLLLTEGRNWNKRLLYNTWGHFWNLLKRLLKRKWIKCNLGWSHVQGAGHGIALYKPEEALPMTINYALKISDRSVSRNETIRRIKLSPAHRAARKSVKPGQPARLSRFGQFRGETSENLKDTKGRSHDTLAIVKI